MIRLAEFARKETGIKSRAATIFARIGTSSCNILRFLLRKALVTPEKLDFIFPFFVLAYGAIMTFVLNIPVLTDLAEERLPHNVVRQMFAHRGLSLFCLLAGALWSLQNIWL